MNERMMSFFLLFMIPTPLDGLASALTLHCPFHSQWHLRAKELCNIPNRYHCLYDANKMQNVEACRDGPQFDAPGYKIQIVGSLEGVQCANGRYQPFIFWTNGSNICVFEKSFCEGEGQIRYLLGTTKGDGTCRCDYTKGYDFVVRPKHTCFCMPTEEDCSCFIRQCPSGFVLSPDYDCAPVQKLLEKSRCPLASSLDNTQTPTLSKDEEDNTHDYHNVLVHGRSHIQKIWIFIPALAAVLTLLGIGICYINVYFNSKYNSDMESWMDSLLKFVPTLASKEILLSIEKNPCVLITGPFGSGKTTMACYIISMLAKDGYETIFVSGPEEIVRRTYRKKKLFIIDDVFGKYSSNISDKIEKWEEYGSNINTILTKSGTVKVLLTCRTYIYLLNSKSFENLKRQISFIHTDLISDKLQLNLEERRKMFQSYFEYDPPKSISDEIMLLYHFYPAMCSSNNKGNLLEYFKHPIDIVSAEIAGMQKLSDIRYLALAILVVLNNKVEISKLSGSSYSEKTDLIFRDIFNESCFNQYPSKNMLLVTFLSLKGEFIMDGETFFSFLSPELFDVVAICIGRSFMKSILTHSSSVFIKEKLQLLTTQGNDCPHAIKVQQGMQIKFYQRLTSDMNNNLIFDVLSNKLFATPKYREKFVGYLETYVKSKKLVDAETGSNVLHIVSSLGYSDFLTYFLRKDKCPGVNKKKSNGETPLHLACQNGHQRCVECLIKCKPAIDETDSNKRTALHYACEAGHETIVKYLITNGAAINKRDLTGSTPLHLACDKGYHGVVKCLVEKKANINEADRKYRTPLHYACKHRMCNIAEILILNKARVNISDDQGSTPLHISCKCGNEEVVKLLVKKKAVTNNKNKQGLTPLDIALQNRFESLSSFLH